MDQLICGLTLAKRVWLADFLVSNWKLPADKRVKRKEIPAKLNGQFPGTGFTVSKMCHLYTHYGSMDEFIAAAHEEERKAQASKASEAKAPINARDEPVESAPKAGIEKPPKAAVPAKPVFKPAPPKGKTMPAIPVKPKIEAVPKPPPRPEPVRVPAPVPAPASVAPSPVVPFPPERKGHSTTYVRYKSGDVTPEMKADIAFALADWEAEIFRQQLFARPAAFAAARVNAKRKRPNDPVLNARTVEDVIGSNAEVESWLLRQPAFLKRFAEAHAVARRVGFRIPPFVDE